MANSKVNLNGLETMVFFWNSIMSKEKVNEAFIHDVCSMREFSYIYDDEFAPESLRMILSALTNKEPYKGNKKERKFYSNNLRVLEYIDEVEPNINAIKHLNLNTLSHKFSNDTEIIIIPGNSGAVIRFDNVLIVDFFSVRISDGKLMIGDISLEEALINA